MQERSTELEQLSGRIALFAAERDWDKFHTPKNLAMALSVEAAELLEIFQWLSAEESELEGAKKERAAEELADVFIYLIRLADKLGIDLLKAADRKLESNARKYPVEKAHGNAKKYTEFTE